MVLFLEGLPVNIAKKGGVSTGKAGYKETREFRTTGVFLRGRRGYINSQPHRRRFRPTKVTGKQGKGVSHRFPS